MSSEEDQYSEEEHGVEHPHEEQDVDTFSIAVGGVILLAGTGVSVLLVAFGVTLLGDVSISEVFSTKTTEVRQLPPEPRLEGDPYEILRKVNQREERLLNRYRWVEQDENRAAIPIEEAMRITVDRLPSEQMGVPTEEPTGATGGRKRPSEMKPAETTRPGSSSEQMRDEAGDDTEESEEAGSEESTSDSVDGDQEGGEQ